MRGLLFLFAVVVSLTQPPDYEVITSKRVMVPMRDGVRLATDIYRPGHGGSPVEGKFPAIVERTPYERSARVGGVIRKGTCRDRAVAAS